MPHQKTLQREALALLTRLKRESGNALVRRHRGRVPGSREACRDAHSCGVLRRKTYARWFSAALCVSLGLISQSARPAKADLGKAVVSKEVDSTCRERLVKLALPAWKRVRERLTGFQSQVSYQASESSSAGRQDISRKWLFCVPNSQTLMTLADKNEDIICANERYSFQLSGRPGRLAVVHAEPWRLAARQPVWKALAKSQSAVNSMLCVFQVPLDEMLTNDQFELIRAQQSGAGDDDLVSVAFHFHGQSRLPYLQKDATYWADVSPRQGWVVAHGGADNLVEAGSHIQIRGTVQCQQWSRDCPFPLIATLEYVEGGKVTDRYVTHFEPPVACSHGAQECYLPFYGIPESIIPADQVTSSWSLLTIGGIVLFNIVSVAIVWLLYRQSRRGAPLTSV